MNRTCSLFFVFLVSCQGFVTMTLSAEEKFKPIIEGTSGKLVLRNQLDSLYFHTSTVDFCIGVKPSGYFRAGDEIFIYVKNNSDTPIGLDPMAIRLSALSLDDRAFEPKVTDPWDYYKGRDAVNVLIAKNPSYVIDGRHVALNLILKEDILPGEQAEGIVLWRHPTEKVRAKNQASTTSVPDTEVELKQLEVQVMVAGEVFHVKFDVSKK